MGCKTKRVPVKMEKLELIEQFKKRYPVGLNPLLYSFMYCQSDMEAFVEVYFRNKPIPFVLDLDFIGGEIEQDEDGNDVDIIPMFKPDCDIVDNACRFLLLDDYELRHFIENLFTEAFAQEINENMGKSLPDESLPNNSTL